MKVVYNKLIPFKGFMAMAFLNIIFVRDEYKGKEDNRAYKMMLNHKHIHFEQEKEMLFIFFYLWYVIEWFIKLFKYGKDSYFHISLEREALFNDWDEEYLVKRKRYSWLKLL